ncbi:MAG: flagellar biosynthetic protein FliR [Desulfobacteraceae bacterium]|nr:MAG: flagellar biosynthetic protein FliR [Desulfobacteraceae bacterium]
MDLVNLQHDEIKVFLFILIRVGIILFLLPFFNSRVIPVLTKAALSLILTVLLFPVSGPHIGNFPGTLWGMSGLIAGEFIIGMILGLLVQMFFEGVRMMGQLAGIETGFSIANVLDPQSGAQSSILSNMAYLISLVLFLILNGHHIILNAIRESFTIIQPGSVNIGKQVFNGLLQSSGDMFVIAIQISAPVVAAVLFVQVAFGLITRLIPQMNVMVVAFPVQIVTGLLFFGISLGVMSHFMERYVGGLDRQLINMMALIKG